MKIIIALLSLGVLTSTNVATAKQNESKLCDSTLQLVGLCAGGLEQSTAKELTVKLGSIRYEKSTKAVGAIAALIANDKIVGEKPILDVLEGYWRCVDRTASEISKMGAIFVAAGSTYSGSDLKEKLSTQIVQDTKQFKELLKNTLVNSAASEGVVSVVTAKDVEQSVKATEKLALISENAQATPTPTTGKTQTPTNKVKSRVSLFVKGKEDPGFDYVRLSNILKEQGLLVNDSAGGVSVHKKNAVVKWFTTNAVWFHPETKDFESVRKVALALVGAGARLKSIQPICTEPGPNQSPHHLAKDLIQVGAWPSVNRKQSYTVDEILGMSQEQFKRHDICKRN